MAEIINLPQKDAGEIVTGQLHAAIKNEVERMSDEIIALYRNHQFQSIIDNSPVHGLVLLTIMGKLEC